MLITQRNFDGTVINFCLLVYFNNCPLIFNKYALIVIKIVINRNLICYRAEHFCLKILSYFPRSSTKIPS